MSACATLTSILGALSSLLMDVPVAKNAFFGATDARVHARYIMALASITNFLAAVAMQPIYMVLALQKIMSCTLNDVSATLETFVNNAQSLAQGDRRGYTTPQLSLTLSFGSGRVQEAIKNAGVATCISEDIRQQVQSSATQVRRPGTSGKPALPGAVAALLSGFLDDAADTVTRAFVGFAYHVIDVFLAWLLGVVRGVQDVAQTLDWDNCKLPVVDTGLRSYGLCACGDDASSIPESFKQQTWAEQGFWCSGFLMLNEADGSDLVVWNPLSLAELLSTTSDSGSSVDRYMQCLRDAPPAGGRSQCDTHKPRHKALEQQGVEVMQVVARCRANYQSARWDEASVLYALFPASVWAELARSDIERRLKSVPDDKWAVLRLAMLRAMKRAGSVVQSRALALDAATWACLDDALRGGALSHDCARVASSAPGRDWRYAEAAGHSFAAVDACRAFSGPAWAEEDTGALALGLPRSMWSGSSTTREPVTRLHAVEETAAEQQAHALSELRAYVEREIEPVFARMDEQKLQSSLAETLDVSAWSVEGDMLHQMVDCVVLGPYAAADLAPSVHDGASRLPAPQYHRGDATRRAFSSWGETGGSPARRAFMKIAIAEVSQHGAALVAGEAWRHFELLRSRWLGGGTGAEGVPGGLLCACERPGQLWAPLELGVSGVLQPVDARLQEELQRYWGDRGVSSLGPDDVAEMQAATGQHFRFRTYVEHRNKTYATTAVTGSVACCAAQVQGDASGADIFFAADVPFERREWDIGDGVLLQALAGLANSSVWGRMLNGENWTHSEGRADLTAAYASRELTPDERARLQEAQLFAPSHTLPVRTYSVSETSATLGGEPLWHACNARVAGLFATQPWGRSRETEDEEVLGALQAAVALEEALERGAPVRGVHALEAAVDRLLAHAHAAYWGGVVFFKL